MSKRAKCDLQRFIIARKQYKDDEEENEQKRQHYDISAQQDVANLEALNRKTKSDRTLGDKRFVEIFLPNTKHQRRTNLSIKRSICLGTTPSFGLTRFP